MRTRNILFLDVASTTGWCQGEVGKKPHYGSIRFAPSGSSPEEVGAKALVWFIKWMMVSKPNTLVIEAPLRDNWKTKTNFNTSFILKGLAFQFGSVAWDRGVFDIRHASVQDVRRHLLGYSPPAKTAKREVIDRVEALGFTPQDDNAADAISGWLYACSIVEPKVAALSTPLFGDKRRSGF